MPLAIRATVDSAMTGGGNTEAQPVAQTQGQGQAQTSSGGTHEGGTESSATRFSSSGDLPGVGGGGDGNPHRRRSASELAYDDIDLGQLRVDVVSALEGRDLETMARLAKRGIDAAKLAEVKLALKVLEELAPLAGHNSAIASAVADARASIMARAPTTAAPTASPIAGYDWTTILVKQTDGSWKPPATIAPADHSKLALIASSRDATLQAAFAKLGNRLGSAANPKHNLVDYHGKKDAGWMYSGNATAATVPDSADPLDNLARQEIITGKGSQEAQFNAIVTYDGTVSIGSGWANAKDVRNAGEYMRRWFRKDPAARELLLQIGFAVTPDDLFAVVDNSGTILTGHDAHAYLTTVANGGMLDYLSGIMEQHDHAQLAMDAQLEMIHDQKVAPLQRNGVGAEMEKWAKDPTRGENAVRTAMHLGGWLYAGGPEANPHDYAASQGFPGPMVRAFARNVARALSHLAQHPNGAIILGTDGYTAQPISGHLDRFGNGYLRPALGSPTPMTVEQAGSDARFSGHVLAYENGKIWDLGK